MSKTRINIILVLLFCVWSIIIGRLFQLQILNNEIYQALAQGRQVKQSFSTGKRGQIFFQSGKPLVNNGIDYHVFAEPLKVSEKGKTVQELEKILETENLEERINQATSFVYLKKDLTKQEVEKIKELDLPGIDIEKNFTREYLNKSMAAQTIGFLGGEGYGQYGIEAYYDDVLRPQEAMTKWGLAGQILGLETNEINGANLFLTLDYNIQFVAEKLLKEAAQKYDIDSGSITVMDPKSGKILALANFPNFDLNHYSQENDYEIFKNQVIQKIFEPGSIFKPLTLAAAINENKITPETKYEDKGYVKIGGRTLKNYNSRVFGKTNMTGVLERSINTGAVYVQKTLGEQLFLDYLEKFGFFKETGIDLYGETYFENLEVKKGYEANLATASYGHGINVTPIQILRAFSSLTNDGRMVTPYLVDKVEQIKKQSNFSASVISPQTAHQTTAMMVSVIENGFAQKAQIPGYYLAGKTGTSLIPWSVLKENKKGYSGKTWQTFIGFGPAFDPEFMILVKLDNPNTGTAEYSAMPVFQDMAKYLIDYLKIPPDYEI